ncbi:DUF11 domain-containing protein [Geomesophilobacter sediminis]|uniref:DUF11 domain-containing protein n=1 Tax=Geomesophilobacter sediminis TaxID=2798584 RepID=A0A8J7J9I2_9BACT|nr:DUF11 domain-containing protein [Geomesophilobacter sediminis]MBJ6723276.1 DUF11 domain-containing protein [Geomesophilobacter sediminis]
MFKPLIQINEIVRLATVASALLALLLVATPSRADAAYQPDLAAKLAREADAAYVGFGVYEADPRTQFKYQSLPTGHAGSFRLTVKNAGDLPDRFTLGGTGSGSGFTVRYLDPGGSDVTAAVAAGTYRTALLQPGESVVLSVEVTPSDLPIGTSYQVGVGAVSAADATRADRFNLETVTCGSTPAVTITSPPDATGTPGGSVVYPYTVTNVGTDTNTFALASGSTAGTSVLIADDGAGGGIAGDGIRQAGETNVASTTGVLAPGQGYRFFAVVTLPGSSVNGNTSVTTVTATGTGATASDQTTTTTVAPVVSVEESVRNFSQGGGFSAAADAQPGETVEYRMRVTNSGAAAATAVVLTAPLPADVTLVPGSVKVTTSAVGDGDPCVPSACGQASAGGNGISAFLGTGAGDGTGGALAPGNTLYVFFRAVVQ